MAQITTRISQIFFAKGEVYSSQITRIPAQNNWQQLSKQEVLQILQEEQPQARRMPVQKTGQSTLH
jgi:hypothetical protein